MTPQETELPTLLPARTQTGQSPSGSDLTLDWMRENGVPLSLQNWLDLNYPEGAPDPLPAEVAATIPPEIRQLPSRPEASATTSPQPSTGFDAVEYLVGQNPALSREQAKADLELFGG